MLLNAWSCLLDVHLVLLRLVKEMENGLTSSSADLKEILLRYYCSLAQIVEPAKSE